MLFNKYERRRKLQNLGRKFVDSRIDSLLPNATQAMTGMLSTEFAHQTKPNLRRTN